jgi:recombination protein RecT
VTTTANTEGTDQTPSTDVATRAPAPPPSVAQFITKLQPEIARALPRGMDADRLARVALTLVRQSELAKAKGDAKHSLAECTLDSFAGALLTCAALGLEPGVNGEAYLIPYKNRGQNEPECTLIVGYQGLVKLFWNHPLAKHIDAQAVHANDRFSYSYGLAQQLRHTPANGDRGPITHYYAVAELSTGASRFVVLTKDEVRALRGDKEGPSGQIKDPMHWMERKTAIKQLVKLLPKSTELSTAVAVDAQPGSVLASRDVATTIVQGDPVMELPPSLEAQTAQRVAQEDASRVTADEILGDDRPANVDRNGVVDPDACEVCGPLGPMGHDLELHAEANIPVPGE